MRNTYIPLGFDNKFFQSGVKTALNWNYTALPHMVIFGSTGSGKTYFSKLLLARIGLKIPNSVVTLCDFKNDDFKSFENLPNYYGFLDCKNGIDNFYEMFKARQIGVDSCRDLRILFFDEFPSFLNMLEKKEAEAYKSKIATLLMLGRSFNCHVLISMQRADASYFANGARDNFSVVVALGNISKEAKQMFFSEFKDEMQSCGRGEGHVLFNGAYIKRIIVPTVRNDKKLEYYIRQALMDK